MCDYSLNITNNLVLINVESEINFNFYFRHLKVILVAHLQLYNLCTYRCMCDKIFVHIVDIKAQHINEIITIVIFNNK